LDFGEESPTRTTFWAAKRIQPLQPYHGLDGQKHNHLGHGETQTTHGWAGLQQASSALYKLHVRKRPLFLLCLLGCGTSTNGVTPDGGVTAAHVKEPLPFEPASASDAPDPALLGPYPVGVMTVVLVDPTRMTPGLTTPRTLTTEIWYPARESSRTTSTETYVLHDYLPEDLKGMITPAALGELPTPAHRNAEPRDDGDTYPLIVFSHGLGGIRLQSNYYTVALASHGYVVVSPDHEGDTLVDLLRAGTVNANTTLDSFVDRPLDVIFLMDHFTSMPAGDALGRIINGDRIGVTGHSFGAITSLRVAGMDARVDAVVAQTPGGYVIAQTDVPTRLEDYGIPVMLQSAGMDRTLPEDPHATSVWEHLVSPRFFIRLPTAGHFTYSDLCVLDVEAIDAAVALDASNVLTDGCGDTNIAAADAYPVINNYAVGLFNRYLRDSAGTGEWLRAERAAQLRPGAATVLSEP